jgi:hypothetical protein
LANTSMEVGIRMDGLDGGAAGKYGIYIPPRACVS